MLAQGSCVSAARPGEAGGCDSRVEAAVLKRPRLGGAQGAGHLVEGAPHATVLVHEREPLADGAANLGVEPSRGRVDHTAGRAVSRGLAQTLDCRLDVEPESIAKAQPGPHLPPDLERAEDGSPFVPTRCGDGLERHRPDAVEGQERHRHEVELCGESGAGDLDVDQGDVAADSPSFRFAGAWDAFRRMKNVHLTFVHQQQRASAGGLWRSKAP